MTGRPIPLARLRALPYATVCVEVQRELERLGDGADHNDIDWGRLPEFDDNEKDVRFQDLELDV